MEGARLSTIRRGRALGLAASAGAVLRGCVTGGGGIVGRAGAGRLPLRVVVSVIGGAGGPAASGDGLDCAGDAGWDLASGSLEVASPSKRVGVLAGGIAGVGSSTGAALQSPVFVGSMNMPETLKSTSPGKRVSTFWMRASTTAWMEETEAKSSCMGSPVLCCDHSRFGPSTMAMLLGVILFTSWCSASLAKNLIRYLRLL